MIKNGVATMCNLGLLKWGESPILIRSRLLQASLKDRYSSLSEAWKQWLAERRDATWLSELVDKKRAAIRRAAPSPPNFFGDLYYPSFTSVAVPVAVVVSTLCYASVLAPLTGEDKVTPGNLLAVESALVAIIFPILIFIIGITADRSEIGLKKSELILHQAFLLPASTFSILALTAVGTINIGISGMVLVALTAILSIGVLFRVILLLLNEQRAITVGIEILKDKVRRSVQDGIDKRLGDNILFERAKALQISSDPFRFRRKEATQILKTTAQGLIVDVNLRMLKSFAEEVRKLEPPPPPANEIAKSKAPRTEPLAIFFHGRFLEANPDEALFSLHKDFRIEDRKPLERLANKILKVQDDDGRSERPRIELNRLREFMLEAIEASRPNAVELGVRYYRVIIDSFLRELSDYGGNYSAKEAKQEAQSILGGGWAVVDCVSNDVREFIEAAARKGNRDILSDVSYLSNIFCVKAIEHEDHFVFRIFCQFPEFLYRLSTGGFDETTKQFLAGAAERHLRDLGSYYVERPLTEAVENAREVPPGSLDFALELITRYQDVIKVAIDNKDLPAVQALIIKLNKLFSNFEPREASNSVRYYEMVINRPETTPTEREQMSRQKDIQSALELTEQTIRDRKGTVISGLAAWALRTWESTSDPIFEQIANLLLGNL